MSAILSFLKRQMLPVGLLCAAAVGLAWPDPGRYMGTLPTQYVAVSIIFFCSGLLLRTDEIQAAFSAWRASGWGIVSILFATPVIGVVIAFQVPVQADFQLGLALFCCMPTTLSSGIALTQQARGNVALALLLTVSTNLLGIFTVPFVLAHLLGALGKVELSALDLLVKLCLTILLPLSAGRCARRYVATWVGRNRTRITSISNLALISVPWMKFSESSAALADVALGSLVVLIAAGLAIHMLYLGMNAAVCGSLGVEVAARKAVVLLASQKTLPVAMTVLALIPEEVLASDVKGLVAIPCITFHLGQIFLDAVVATRWAAVDGTA